MAWMSSRSSSGSGGMRAAWHSVATRSARCDRCRSRFAVVPRRSPRAPSRALRAPARSSGCCSSPRSRRWPPRQRRHPARPAVGRADVDLPRPHQRTGAPLVSTELGALDASVGIDLPGDDTVPDHGAALRCQRPARDRAAGRRPAGRPALRPGRPKGYNCGLDVVGYSSLGDRGGNSNLAWAGDCAFVAGDGIAVINVKDPAAPPPRHAPCARRARCNTLETLAARTSTAAARSSPPVATASFMDFSLSGSAPVDLYDVSDCDNPKLLSTTQVPDGRPQPHAQRRPHPAVVDAAHAGPRHLRSRPSRRTSATSTTSSGPLGRHPSRGRPRGDHLRRQHAALPRRPGARRRRPHDRRHHGLAGAAGPGRVRLRRPRPQPQPGDHRRAALPRALRRVGRPADRHTRASRPTSPRSAAPPRPFLTDISDETAPVDRGRADPRDQRPGELRQLAPVRRERVVALPRRRRPHGHHLRHGVDVELRPPALRRPRTRDAPQEVAYFNPGQFPLVPLSFAGGSIDKSFGLVSRTRLDIMWGHIRYDERTGLIWAVSRNGGFWVLQLQPQLRDRLGLPDGLPSPSSAALAGQPSTRPAGIARRARRRALLSPGHHAGRTLLHLATRSPRASARSIARAEASSSRRISSVCSPRAGTAPGVMG